MIEIKSAEYLRDRAAELERNLVYLRNMAIANIMDLEESEKCRLLAEEYIASVGGGKQYTEDEKRLIGVILRYQEHIDDNVNIKTQYKLVISPIGDGILDGMYGTLDSCIEMWKYPTKEMQDFYFKGKEFAAVTKIALMVIAGMGDYGKNVEAAQNRPPVKPDVDYSNVRDMVSKGAGSRYNPANPGPLSDDIADTFRGGSYTETVLTEDTTFYRVYGDKAGMEGSFMTRTPQNGGLQSQIDLALDPQWGNTATSVTTVTVPKGTVIYEGFASQQGNLLGGGSQVYIPRGELNPSWFGK